MGGALFAFAHLRAIRASSVALPGCMFPSIANDTHIVVPSSVLGDAYLHFIDQLALIGLSVQPRKRRVWSPLPLPDSFTSTLSIPPWSGGIRVLGVPFGGEEFECDLLQEALPQDYFTLNNWWPWEMSRLLSLLWSSAFFVAPRTFFRLCPHPHVSIVALFISFNCDNEGFWSSYWPWSP